MNFDEIKAGVSDAFKERMSSPFLGSVILSWPIINYKLLLVMFGQGRYEGKINYIENVIYDNSGLSFWGHAALLPIGAGLFYTLVYPRIDTLLTAAHLKLAHKKKREMILSEQRKPVDEEYQAAYFAEWEQKNALLRSTIDATNKEYRALRGESEKRIALLEQRIRRQTLRRIVVECGGGAVEHEFLRDGLASATTQSWMHPERRLFLKKHPYFHALQQLLVEIDATPQSQETYLKVLQIDRILQVTGLEKDSSQDFLEMLSAFNIIKDFEEENPQQVTIDPMKYSGSNDFLSNGWGESSNRGVNAAL